MRSLGATKRLLGLLGVAVVLGGLGGGVAGAQERPADTMEVLREQLRADKKAVVALTMELTEGEARGFWPVYAAYQSDMIAHYDRVAKLIETFAGAYRAMTDEVATQLVEEFVAIETEHIALLSRYVPRFRRVLSPAKVARFYQLENKVRALVNWELAREIPLLK